MLPHPTPCTRLRQVTSEACDAFLSLCGLPATVMQPAFGMAETCTCITYANDYAGGMSGSVVRLPARRYRLGCPAAGQTDAAAGRGSPGAPASPAAARAPPTSADPSFVHLGPPAPSVELRVTATPGPGPPAVLRQGQVGHLQVRGPMVMPGYFRNPCANAACLLPGGWLETGDLAFLDGGRLVVAGRAKELVIVRGANFYCHEIEEAAGGVRGVATARVAVTSVRDEALGTEVLIVFFVPSEPMAAAALPHLCDGILIEALRRSGPRGTWGVALGTGVSPIVSWGKGREGRCLAALPTPNKTYPGGCPSLNSPVHASMPPHPTPSRPGSSSPSAPT